MELWKREGTKKVSRKTPQYPTRHKKRFLQACRPKDEAAGIYTPPDPPISPLYKSPLPSPTVPLPTPRPTDSREERHAVIFFPLAFGGEILGVVTPLLLRNRDPRVMEAKNRGKK